jgi:type IV pilus assembly protein PilV
MLSNRNSIKRKQTGFLLIEVLVSLLIFSIGLLALIGMQNFSINDTLHGKYRTDASYLANSIVGQMMIDRNNISSYADGGSSTNRSNWDTQVSAALPNGTTSISITGGSTVTVVIGWKNPNETQAHNYTALAQVVF